MKPRLKRICATCFVLQHFRMYRLVLTANSLGYIVRFTNRYWKCIMKWELNISDLFVNSPLASLASCCSLFGMITVYCIVCYGRSMQQMRTLYFGSVSFFFFLSFFPRLISAVADWMSTMYHTSIRGVVLVRFRMQVWNVLLTARWKYGTQKSRQKSQSGHHRTTLSGYIFFTHRLS